MSSVLWVSTWPQVTVAATGAAPTVQANEAGAGSGLPAASTARDREGVGADGEAAVHLAGEVQGAKPRRRASTRRYEPASLLEKVKVATVLTVVGSGDEVDRGVRGRRVGRRAARSST